jgi:hypothetical protein
VFALATLKRVGRRLKRAACLVLVATLAAPAGAGAALPRWVRIVDAEGQVLDYGRGGLAAVALCAEGVAALRASAEGEGGGMLDIELVNGAHVVGAYDAKFYNDGAGTDDPNNSGDQTVFVMAMGRIAYDAFEFDCATFVHE